MKNYTLNDLIIENKILVFFFNEKKNIVALAIRFILIYYSIPLLLFLLSYLNNTLYIDGEGIGFLEDYLFITTAFFVAPAFILSVRIILSRFVMLVNSINSFTKSNVEIEIKKVIDETLLRVKQKNFKTLLLKIGIGAIVISTSTYTLYNRGQSWNSYDSSLEFLMTTLWLIIIISIITNQILFKYLFLILAQIKLTKSLIAAQLIEIKPLHPDKAGGLKSLGNLALSYTYFLLPFLLIIIAHMLTLSKVTVGFVMAISAYIPLIIFVFFYPLGLVHDAMINAKLEILNKISSHFHQINTELLGKTSIDEKKLLEKKPIIELLDNLYQKADKIPNWPFDTVTIAKFGSILAAIIGSFWLNWLFKQLVKS